MRKKFIDKKSVVKFEEDIDMVIEELEVEVCDKEDEASMEVIENLKIDTVDNQEDNSSTDRFEELEVEVAEDKEAEVGMKTIENLEIDAVDNQEDEVNVDILNEQEDEVTIGVDDRGTVDLSQNKIVEPMLKNYLNTGDITKENQDDVSLINHALDNVLTPNPYDYSSVDSQSVSRVIGSAGIMSIINSLTNGKRFTFSKELMLKLKHPERVQIGTNSNSIIIGVKLPFKCNDFKISKTGGKSIIYSGPLVMEITKKFDLDYSNRTSITFHDVAYGEFEGFPYAIIKIINND